MSKTTNTTEADPIIQSSTTNHPVINHSSSTNQPPCRTYSLREAATKLDITHSTVKIWFSSLVDVYSEFGRSEELHTSVRGKTRLTEASLDRLTRIKHCRDLSVSLDDAFQEVETDLRAQKADAELKETLAKQQAESYEEDDDTDISALVPQTVEIEVIEPERVEVTDIYDTLIQEVRLYDQAKTAQTDAMIAIDDRETQRLLDHRQQSMVKVARSTSDVKKTKNTRRSPRSAKSA